MQPPDNRGHRQQAVDSYDRRVPSARFAYVCSLACSLKHTFRFLKQVLGWTRPEDSNAARPPPTAGPGSSSPATPSSRLRPGHPRTPPTCACPGSRPLPRRAGLTPARVRAAGSRNPSARPCTARPEDAPKPPGKPGPRPASSEYKETAARPPAHDVGKTVKRDHRPRRKPADAEGCKNNKPRHLLAHLAEKPSRRRGGTERAGGLPLIPEADLESALDDGKLSYLLSRIELHLGNTPGMSAGASGCSSRQHGCPRMPPNTSSPS